MDQGSTMKRSAVHNFAPTVTKFCVMWEGQALPHDTKCGNSRCEIIGRRVIFIWSLIHGLRWSGLIKAEPCHHISWSLNTACYARMVVLLWNLTHGSTATPWKDLSKWNENYKPGTRCIRISRDHRLNIPVAFRNGTQVIRALSQYIYCLSRYGIPVTKIRRSL